MKKIVTILFCLMVAYLASKAQIIKQKQVLGLSDSLASKQHVQLYIDSVYGGKVGSFSPSDFNASGMSYVDSAGHIVISGGGSTFTKSINLNVNQRFGLTNYYMNHERWTVAIRFNVRSHGIIGIGTRSTTINSSGAGAFAFLNTATGHGFFKGEATSDITINLGDEVEMVAVRDGFQVSLSCRNITTNSATAVATGEYLISDGDVPVTGQYAVFAYSGKQYCDSIKVTSQNPMYADILAIGDSKTQGYNTNYLQRWASLLGNYYKMVCYGGGFETTADWVTTIQDVIAHKPKYVLLTNPSNDLRTGINTDSTKARYYRMEVAFRAAGIAVIHSNGFYETSVPPTAWVSYINSTRLKDSVIDTYTLTNIAGFLDVDGVHPTVFGASVIANSIYSSGKFAAAINPAFAPKNFITAQTTTAENKGFYVNKASRVANKLSFGDGVGGHIQLYGYLDEANGVRWEKYGVGGTAYDNMINSGRTSYFDEVLNRLSLNVYVGSTASINSLNLDNAGNATTYGKFTTGNGTDLAGLLAVNHRLSSDQHIYMYSAGGVNYFQSSDAGRSTNKDLYFRTNSFIWETNAGQYMKLTNAGNLRVGGSGDGTSTADIVGSLSTSWIAKTTTYTATSSDQNISCSGTFTLTLPTAVGIAGRIYTVKNTGTGTINIVGTSGQTFDGASSISAAIQYEVYYLKSNGTNWEVN